MNCKKEINLTMISGRLFFLPTLKLNDEKCQNVKSVILRDSLAYLPYTCYMYT